MTTTPLTDLDVELILSGAAVPRSDLDRDLVDLVDALRLSPEEPVPPASTELALVLAGLASVEARPAPAAQTPRRVTRTRLAAWFGGLGLGAQIALGTAGAAAAAVTVGGAAGVLPAPAQHAFDGALQHLGLPSHAQRPTSVPGGTGSDGSGTDTKDVQDHGAGPGDGRADEDEQGGAVDQVTPGQRPGHRPGQATQPAVSGSTDGTGSTDLTDGTGVAPSDDAADSDSSGSSGIEPQDEQQDEPQGQPEDQGGDGQTGNGQDNGQVDGEADGTNNGSGNGSRGQGGRSGSAGDTDGETSTGNDNGSTDDSADGSADLGDDSGATPPASHAGGNGTGGKGDGGKGDGGGKGDDTTSTPDGSATASTA